MSHLFYTITISLSIDSLSGSSTIQPSIFSKSHTLAKPYKDTLSRHKNDVCNSYSVVADIKGTVCESHAGYEYLLSLEYYCGTT